MNKYRLFMDETLKRAETPQVLLKEDSASFDERRYRTQQENLQALLFGLTVFAVGVALGYYLGAKEAHLLINDFLAK